MEPGSDIAMAFDECAPYPATREYMINSVNRTTRWLERCKKKMQELNDAEGTVNPHQLLFGINQGGTYADIRVNHARTIRDMDLDGYAIGGLAVGETHEEMYRILDEVVPELPQNKPTYLMGVEHRPTFWKVWTEVLISLTVFIRQETDVMDMFIPTMAS